jgi:hypothetical protein
MSMSLYMFSDRPVQSMSEWQAAIIADGFAAELYKPAVFAELSGFLPVKLDGAGTGFEVDHEDSPALIAELAEEGLEVDRQWTHALSFHWGGDYRELIAAYATAGSYARVTEGVVFDCQEAKVYQPAAVLEMARKMAVDLKDELGPPRYEWQDAQ